MDAGSLLEFKKKPSTLRTGWSIPESGCGLAVSLELKLPRGCQNILGSIITHVPCTLPSARAVSDGIQSKTNSFRWASGQERTNSLGLGLHVTTSHISVKKPPPHCSDVKRKMLLLCQLRALLCLCPPPGLAAFPREASARSSVPVKLSPRRYALTV